MKPNLGAFAALCLFTVSFAAGCYRPDVPRLRAHVEGSCHVAFAGPRISCDDAEVVERMMAQSFERAALWQVTDPATEQCLLDVDCSDDDPALDDDAEFDADTAALVACLADDPQSDPGNACLNVCEAQVRDCDPGCDEAAHAACLDDRDRCRSAC
jgi:hypothetical protein